MISQAQADKAQDKTHHRQYQSDYLVATQGYSQCHLTRGSAIQVSRRAQLCHSGSRKEMTVSNITCCRRELSNLDSMIGPNVIAGVIRRR